MAFKWFMSWISTILSYPSQENEKQGHDSSKECNGPCDLAQDNWDKRKIGKSFKIHFFGKEFNILLAVCLHTFADNAEKQGQDLNKEDKGSNNLCQEIFAHETEKQVLLVKNESQFNTVQ